MTFHNKFGPDNELTEIPGDLIAALLKGEFASELALALVGCKFYRVDPDAPATILGCDPSNGRLNVEDAQGAKRTFALDGGFLYLEPAVAAVLELHESAEKRTRERQRRELQALGFKSSAKDNDLSDLLFAFKSAAGGCVPPFEERRRLLDMMGRYEEPTAIVKVARAWFDCSKDQLLADVLIKLVSALRKTGCYDEALARTEFLHKGACGLTPEQVQILLTSRAGAWLDQFKATGRASAFQEASRCANEAAQFGSSTFLDALLRRMRRMGRPSEDPETE